MALVVFTGVGSSVSGAEGWRASRRSSDDAKVTQVARPKSKQTGGLLGRKLGSWLNLNGKKDEDAKGQKIIVARPATAADGKRSQLTAGQLKASEREAGTVSTAKEQVSKSAGAKSSEKTETPKPVRVPSLTEQQLLQNLRRLNKPTTAAPKAVVESEAQPAIGDESIFKSVSFEPVQEPAHETARPLIPLKIVPAPPEFTEAAGALPSRNHSNGQATSEARQLADSLAPKFPAAHADRAVSANQASSSNMIVGAPSNASILYGNGYQSRMAQVMRDDQHTSLGEAWHNHSLQWNRRNRYVSDKIIEFYDPELEEPFDTDDYHMPIVVTAASVADEHPQDTNRSDLLTRKLTDIRPSLSYAWRDIDQALLPKDFHDKMDYGVYERTQPPLTVLQWAPTNFWHYPLYFEDPALERYGHTYHPAVQPFASSGRFFGQLVGLPYQMCLHPVKSREYTLGYYRPGEWAPKKKYQIPFNQEAATIETLTIVGLFFLIP